LALPPSLQRNEVAHRKAQVKAAERDTCVSVLVREFLSALAGEEGQAERRKRLQAEVLALIRRFRAADRLDRGSAHRRRALP
jgi:hypothetical protein